MEIGFPLRKGFIKYLNHIQVEPTTKLYPAVFVEPTVKEVLQFELGRIKVGLIEEYKMILFVL
jgi:hypothetical protein